MTRMLYTGFVMNNKPPIPDETIMFSKHFSFWTSLKVSRWWLVAMIISYLSDLQFRDVVKQWSLGWRLVIIFAEFFAILLFVFDAMRFIRRMDELQRRITQAALFFSVSASFFFFMLWLYLNRAGFFNAVLGPPPDGTWGIASIAHVCVLLGGFYGLGFLIFKRRYK
jgi:hypothetical protein